MDFDKSKVLVYTSKSGYTVFFVSRTIEDMVRLTGIDYDSILKCHIKNLDRKGRYNLLEHIQPYSLKYSGVKNPNGFPNQGNIETLVFESAPMNEEDIDNKFRKWMDDYVCEYKKAINKELSGLNLINARMGKFEEYGVDRIDGILHSMMNKMENNHKHEKKNDESNIELYLNVCAFGTKIYDSVRSLISVAYSSNFDISLINLMIRRVSFILAGRKEESSAILDLVLDKLKDKKYIRSNISHPN